MHSRDSIVTSRRAKRADMDKLVKLFHHPLPRVLFWLTIILIFEALDIPWRWRKLRARLS
jgi:hypothetical protein